MIIDPSEHDYRNIYKLMVGAIVPRPIAFVSTIVNVSAKPLGGSLVIGEVLRFHIDDALFDSYKIDPDKLHAIGRMGGPTYVRTTDRFDMTRPKTGEIKS